MAKLVKNSAFCARIRYNFFLVTLNRSESIFYRVPLNFSVPESIHLMYFLLILIFGRAQHFAEFAGIWGLLESIIVQQLYRARVRPFHQTYMGTTLIW